MKNSANVFLGILGAASAGVIIGMLIAPEKGEELRGKLKNTANDLTKKLGDLIAQGKQQYDQLKSQAGEEAENLKNEASNSYKRSKSNV